MDVSEAKELLLRMEDQVRQQIETACQFPSKASEPECEIHSSEASSIASSHKQMELQEHLDEICSLRDLFVMQSQALSMIQEGEKNNNEKQERPCSPIPLVVASIPDPDEFSASSILLLEKPEAAATKEKKSFDETVEETTKSLEDGIVLALQEISPTCVSKLYSNTLGNDDSAKMQDFDGADSDTNSLYPDFDGTDSEIQAAINEIRREASQMDAVMALDQLKTLESDLEVTTKALQERSTEVEDLKIQVEELEERVGSLELERDLFKADASKLKEDLKTCVERMFDISNVAGDSSIIDAFNSQNDRKKEAQDQLSTSQISDKAVTGKSLSALSTNQSLPAAPKTVIDHAYPSISSSNRDGDDVKTQLYSAPNETREVIRRAPTFSDPSFDRTPLLDLPLTVTTHSKAAMNAKTVNAQRDAIFRRTESFCDRRSISSHSSLFGNNTSPRVGRPLQKQRSSSFSVERRRDDNRSQIDGKDNNRRCSLFRRSSSRRRNASSNRDDIEIMREQISQLHQMMKTSLSTSEKLRNRLAMISRYYEGIIRKLQEQVVETKTEKKTMEVQLANQMAQIDHENRVMIMQLEMKLQRKEDEIKRLRQQHEI